ncbi:MAG: MFS transporter [Bacillota bacterium]
MKLNVKQTLLVGLAFMSITMFSQLYDGIVPKILVNEFGLSETIKGMVMAIDNVLAVFLMPLFGAISDKVSTPYGKRMPFVVIGTIFAVIFIVFVPISVSANSILMFFFAIMAILVVMSTYRSPAVALMPDVTPPHLRSKGNAIINLMGTIGGTIILGLITFIYKDGVYMPIFLCVAVLMLICIIVMVLTVKENKLLEICHAQTAEYEKQNGVFKTEEELASEETGNDNLSKEQKRSLLFILMSILFWFMAYNAVTTGYSMYAELELGLTDGSFASPLIVANVAALVAFIPIGNVATKLGRKKTIIAGVITLGIAFAIPMFLNENTSFLITPAFVLAGFGWAAINVNSLPMVVQMSKGKTLGKYTGMYYTFSMSAQIVTPILSGALIGYMGEVNQKFTSSGTFADYSVLFPYAVVFTVLALITMSQVKHGEVND